MGRLTLKLLIAALVMIAGAAAAFSGVLKIASSDAIPAEALAYVVLGPVLALGGLAGLLRAKRKYHHDAWQAAVDDPDSIYARWTDRRGREILFAKTGLFTDRKWFAFAKSHNRIASIGLEDGVLRIVVDAYAGENYTKDVSVEVPPDQREAVKRGVGKLRAHMR